MKRRVDDLPQPPMAVIEMANKGILPNTQISDAPRCLVPQCDGVKYEQLPSWEAVERLNNGKGGSCERTPLYRFEPAGRALYSIVAAIRLAVS